MRIHSFEDEDFERSPEEWAAHLKRQDDLQREFNAAMLVKYMKENRPIVPAFPPQQDRIPWIMHYDWNMMYTIKAWDHKMWWGEYPEIRKGSDIKRVFLDTKPQ